MSTTSTAFVIKHTSAFDRTDAEVLPDICRRPGEVESIWALLVVNGEDADAADAALEKDPAVIGYEAYVVAATADHDAQNIEIAHLRGIETEDQHNARLDVEEENERYSLTHEPDCQCEECATEDK